MRPGLGLGWGVFAVAVLVLGGCAKQEVAPYETFFTEAEAYKPVAGSGNAWDGYLLAAGLAARQADKFSAAVNFTKAERDEFLARSEAAVDLAVRASGLPVRVEFRASDPFRPRRSHDGWTMIGRAMAWRIEDACQLGRYEEASRLVVAATKMGTDLGGGDVKDALLGYWIAEQAREAVAPYLPQFDARTLQALGRAVLEVQAGAPQAGVTLGNELENMRAGVQFVQDAYRDRSFEILHEAMYKEVSEAVSYLEDMPEHERPGYFRGFMEEGEARVAWGKSQAEVPAHERSEFEAPRSERPWRRFAKHLFETVGSFLTARDRHLARTRLLGLTALGLASGKATGKAPARWEGLPRGSTVDPYSGREFPYRVAGREFRIYSVGQDGRDDGGDTNDTGLSPDLVLSGL